MRDDHSGPMALSPRPPRTDRETMMNRTSQWEPPPGQWPDRSGAARVLVEDPDGAERWALKKLLERHGYDVLVCGGPTTLKDGQCPLVAEGSCPAAAGADVVFSHLRLTDPSSRAVVDAIRAELPDTAVVVEVEQHRAASVPEGCAITLTPVTGKHAVEAVDSAVWR